MNEHIRRLAGEALDRAVPETWTTLTAYDLNKFTEVFAELIVRECAGEVLKWKSDPFPLDPDFAAKAIREHFGVKS